MKKIVFILMTALLICSNGMKVSAAECVNAQTDVSKLASEIEPYANYGVVCCVCGRDDCMQFMFYEQAGIGGTTHRMYYKCTNCGGMTVVTMNAR